LSRSSECSHWLSKGEKDQATRGQEQGRWEVNAAPCGNRGASHACWVNFDGRFEDSGRILCCACYVVRGLDATSLVTDDFVKAFVAEGQVNFLHSSGRFKEDSVHLSIDRNGHLHASFFDDKGKRVTFRRDLRMLARATSSSSAWTSLAAQVKSAFPQPLEECWLAWKPCQSDVCPSSVAKYMQDVCGARVEETWPNETFPVQVHVDHYPRVLSRDAEGDESVLSNEDAADAENLLGMAMLTIDNGQQGNQTVEIQTFKGLYSAESLRTLTLKLDKLMDKNAWCLVAECSSLPASSGGVAARYTWGVAPTVDSQFFEWSNYVLLQN
jgi:hypothetical protein